MHVRQWQEIQEMLPAQEALVIQPPLLRGPFLGG